MIIQWFAEMFFKVITSLLNWINLPHLNESLFDGVNDYLNLILGDSIAMFNFFVPQNIYKICIPIVLAVTAFKYGYFFVMWILKKIPAAGVS